MSADSINGEKSIINHSEERNLKFYSSWFCPYAQRVWISLEEKGVDYQYIEINPYEDNLNGDLSSSSSSSSSLSSSSSSTKIALSISEKKIRYPLFMEASPRGLIPAVTYKSTDQKEDKIADSMVCLQYIDEVFNNSNSDDDSNNNIHNHKDNHNHNNNNNKNQKYDSFLQGDATAAQRAHVRFWCIHINERIIPHYYKMLMCKDNVDDQELAKQNLLVGLKEFAQAMPAVTTMTSISSSECNTSINISVNGKRQNDYSNNNNNDNAVEVESQGQDGEEQGVGLTKRSSKRNNNNNNNDYNNDDNNNNDGPFFMGNVFSIVDITLAPWFQRILSVLKVYRQFELPTGFTTVTVPPTPPTSDSEADNSDADDSSDSDSEYQQPKKQKLSNQQNQHQNQSSSTKQIKTHRIITDPDFVRLHIWYEAVSHRPSFQRTVVNETRLIQNYSGYAVATATSDVAQRMVLTQQSHQPHQHLLLHNGTSTTIAGATYDYEQHVYGQVYEVNNNNNNNSSGIDVATATNGIFDCTTDGNDGYFDISSTGGNVNSSRNSKKSSSCRSSTAAAATLIPPKYEIPLSEHFIGNLINLPHFAHLRGTNLRARMNCRICNTKQSTFCVTCSTDPLTGDMYTESQYLFPVCNLTSERPCFVNHLNY